jgi:holo-[acyl-carrier-protein] synthase
MSLCKDVKEVKVNKVVYGIGTDICDIRRIRSSYERYGDRFLQRILTPFELQVFGQRSERWPERGVRFLATRFSAKESFSKAIGMGMRHPMTWRSCEISNAPSGEPQIVLHDALKVWCQARRLSAKVSVSDESDYAISFVTVEQSLEP